MVRMQLPKLEVKITKIDGLVKLNLERGSFEELDYQHDEAWIGGPGIPSYADASGSRFSWRMKQFTFNQKQRIFSFIYLQFKD
jgi:hypothetical protein